MDMLQLQKLASPEIDGITISDSTIQKIQTEESSRMIPAGAETPTPSPEPRWISSSLPSIFKWVHLSKDERQ